MLAVAVSAGGGGGDDLSTTTAGAGRLGGGSGGRPSRSRRVPPNSGNNSADTAGRLASPEPVAAVLTCDAELVFRGGESLSTYQHTQLHPDTDLVKKTSSVTVSYDFLFSLKRLHKEQ